MPGDAYDFDHIIALCNGGENRESNIALALREKHRAKTAKDVAEKSKVARIRAKHLGLAKPKTRGFDKRFTKGFDGQVRPRT
jgi:5-methylcytosine-specific restriction endonuclease McrA